MRYATTFSGIGGWEIGLNACGWELAWQCEREPFCRTLLTERFGVPICRDIRHLVRWLEGMRHRGFDIVVDVLVGSPPCQPFSVAGAQRGTADPRHLFPVFLGVVRFLQPTWILMEQVPAILSAEGGKAFEGYVGGLAALGYDLLWHCVPACAVGACHRRDRTWIIAHARGEQYQSSSAAQQWSSTPGFPHYDADAARRVQQRTAPGASGHSALLGEAVADATGKPARTGKSKESGLDPLLRRQDGPHPACELRHGSRHAGTEGRVESSDIHPSLPDADRAGLQGRVGQGVQKHPPQIDSRPVRPLVADAPPLCGEHQLGDEPRRILPGDGSAAFLDYERWAHTIPGWWLVEPPVGRVADGIPHRVDSLKGLGNAVVPQIPFLIGQAINAFCQAESP